jgi:hypothetical protein
MPGIDEDILRELMHRSTADLHAPSAVTTSAIGRQRRLHRSRLLSAGVSGAAAVTVVALVAASGGAQHAGAPAGPAKPQTVRLTAAQQVIYHLSSAAAAAHRPAGRYVVLTEIQSGGGDGSATQNIKRTSVIDSATGDVWTYQAGPGVPSELPMDAHGSPTQAEFDAWPTGSPQLRALLIQQAQLQARQAQQAMEAQIAKLPPKLRRLKRAIPVVNQHETGDDLAFGQATDWLWNPLLSPSLRSALYKVLASIPGVVVNTHATDMQGRASIEISRVDSGSKADVATFEDPSTGAVLESLFLNPPSHAGASDGFNSDLYQSITSQATLPANPYAG